MPFHCIVKEQGSPASLVFFKKREQTAYCFKLKNVGAVSPEKKRPLLGKKGIDALMFAKGNGEVTVAFQPRLSAPGMAVSTNMADSILPMTYLIRHCKQQAAQLRGAAAGKTFPQQEAVHKPQ